MNISRYCSRERLEVGFPIILKNVHPKIKNNPRKKWLHLKIY